MRKLLFLLFGCVLLFGVSLLSAQQRFDDKPKTWKEYEEDSWEPEDIERAQITNVRTRSLISPFTPVTLKLIRSIEKDRSESVNFCPFKTSCTRFAYQAILHRGLFHGALQFLDRYYYRKNSTASYLYPLVETEEGVLKLDDDFFLKK